MKHVAKFVSFFMFPALVLLAHAIASSLVLNLYQSFPNLDIPFHFMGGFSIAYTASRMLSYMEREKLINPMSQIVLLTTIFSLMATATVFWEFAEFITDRLLELNVQISLANTMQDQCMGVLGGAALILIQLWDQKLGPNDLSANRNLE